MRLTCECAIHRELDVVAGVGAESAARYGGTDLNDEARAYVERQAAKRVAMQFQVRDTASWDHRKL